MLMIAAPSRSGGPAATLATTARSRRPPEPPGEPRPRECAPRRLKTKILLPVGYDGWTQLTATRAIPGGRFAGLGIESSPSFVRQPETNGITERVIHTLKEILLWVRPFATIEHLRQALLGFRQTPNSQWLLARHGLPHPGRTPTKAPTGRCLSGHLSGFRRVQQARRVTPGRRSDPLYVRLTP
jgi:hypothetical protein